MVFLSFFLLLLLLLSLSLSFSSFSLFVFLLFCFLFVFGVGDQRFKVLFLRCVCRKNEQGIGRAGRAFTPSPTSKATTCNGNWVHKQLLEPRQQHGWLRGLDHEQMFTRGKDCLLRLHQRLRLRRKLTHSRAPPCTASHWKEANSQSSTSGLSSLQWHLLATRHRFLTGSRFTPYM